MVRCTVEEVFNHIPIQQDRLAFLEGKTIYTALASQFGYKDVGWVAFGPVRDVYGDGSHIEAIERFPDGSYIAQRIYPNDSVDFDMPATPISRDITLRELSATLRTDAALFAFLAGRDIRRGSATIAIAADATDFERDGSGALCVWTPIPISLHPEDVVTVKSTEVIR